MQSFTQTEKKQGKETLLLHTYITHRQRQQLQLQNKEERKKHRFTRHRPVSDLHAYISRVCCVLGTAKSPSFLVSMPLGWPRMTHHSMPAHYLLVAHFLQNSNCFEDYHKQFPHYSCSRVEKVNELVCLGHYNFFM